MIIRFSLVIIILSFPLILSSQHFPDPAWDLPLPMVYGKDVPVTLGDPDHFMDIFFVIPENYDRKVYFRVYDPGAEGEHDVVRDDKSFFQYTLLGGNGCFVSGDHFSGTILARRSFGSTDEYDMVQETIGGCDVSQGEYISWLKGYLFKVVIEGLTGYNGNGFRVEVSAREDYPVPIEGARVFSDEITFNLDDIPEEVAHFYPLVCEGTKKIIISTYDMEKEGNIRVVSPDGKISELKVSGDDEWVKNELAVRDVEVGRKLDIQIRNSKKPKIQNNIITIRVVDQEGRPLVTEPWSISRYDPH
jgi:hypothetical protein